MGLKTRKALLAAAEVVRQQAAILEALADEETNAQAPRAIDDQELLTINEAAALLKMSRSWVYGRLQSRELNATYLGGRTRISRAQLDAFVKSATPKND